MFNRFLRPRKKAVARILWYLRSILRHSFVDPFCFHGKLPYKLAYLKARSQHKRKLTILCYPQVPRSINVLYKLAHFAGCRITDNPKARHDLVVRFEDTTYASIDDVLSRLAERTDVLNARCTDISICVVVLPIRSARRSKGSRSSKISSEKTSANGEPISIAGAPAPSPFGWKSRSKAEFRCVM